MPSELGFDRSVGDIHFGVQRRGGELGNVPVGRRTPEISSGRTARAHRQFHRQSAEALTGPGPVEGRIRLLPAFEKNVGATHLGGTRQQSLVAPHEFLLGRIGLLRHQLGDNLGRHHLLGTDGPQRRLGQVECGKDLFLGLTALEYQFLHFGIYLRFGTGQAELPLCLGHQHPVGDHQHERPGKELGVHGVPLGRNQGSHFIEGHRVAIDRSYLIGPPTRGENHGQDHDRGEDSVAYKALARGEASQRASFQRVFRYAGIRCRMLMLPGRTSTTYFPDHPPPRYEDRSGAT